MSTAVMNGHHQGQSTSARPWPTTSVRDFFEQIPWTGVVMRSPETALEDALGASSVTSSLSLTLSVGVYFNQFPWDGKPHIAAPVAPLDIQPDLPEDDGITLDGIADLF